VDDLPEPYRPPLVRDRAGLLAAITDTWSELETFVNGLTEHEFGLRTPGLGEGADVWTVRDVVVHLAAWRRNVSRVAELQAAPNAQRLNDFPGTILGFETHPFNAALLREWRDSPLSAVLDEHRASYTEMVRALELVPERNLLLRGRSVLWLTPGMGHAHLHLLDLRAAVSPATNESRRK